MRQNGNPTLKPVARFGKSVGSNLLRRLWKKCRALAGATEPDVETAIADPRVLVEDCVRRAVDPSLTLLGTHQRGPVEYEWPADNGYGEMCTLAYADIKRERDLHSLAPGTHVATVLVDLDVWTYDVDYQDLDEPALRVDGGTTRPPTQGFVRADEAGQYVVCAGVEARGRPCGGRLRLDERASDERRWVWRCPECDEELIQARGGRR